MIRPFQFSDIFLIQRLGRQAAKLNIVQALLQPQSAFWASLSAAIPWNDAKAATYVLRQHGHGLVRLGFLQVQKRSGRPEAEIVRLAPDLDSALGHPAIWEKLLAHYTAIAAQQQIVRLYVEAPDQPLSIHTLSHVGFRSYARQTIWRLPHHQLAGRTHSISADIRPRSKADDWALQQLYMRTVPKAVQMAEGMDGDPPVKPPILDWWGPGTCNCFVLEKRQEVIGALQFIQGTRSVWLQLWTDMNNPDTTITHELLRYGLMLTQKRELNRPVYVGVCDYHGGLSAILADYGFAPVTDRVKLVRPVVKWIREPALESVGPLESPAYVAPAQFRQESATSPQLPLPGSAGYWAAFADGTQSTLPPRIFT